MNIKDIEMMLKKTTPEKLLEVMEPFRLDDRVGVQKLLLSYEKKYQAHKTMLTEWDMRMAFDEVFDAHSVLVGIDEVGRGPLAGPVIAAAVILPENATIPGLKDSKLLSEARREALYELIQEQALAIGIGIVDAKRIDRINILQATFEAMRQALTQIKIPYHTILVDGNQMIPQITKKQEKIIGGDNKSASIAAASVIAKVTRDRMMLEYNKLYPGYEWDHNKGYGSKQHYLSIKEKGVTPLHRLSFLKNEGIK